jgi:hypothetical protein
VSVTTPDYAMALYWPWLNQIYGPRPIRCAKPLGPKSPRIFGIELDFAEALKWRLRGQSIFRLRAALKIGRSRTHPPRGARRRLVAVRRRARYAAGGGGGGCFGGLGGTMGRPIPGYGRPAAA